MNPLTRLLLGMVLGLGAGLGQNASADRFAASQGETVAGRGHLIRRLLSLLASASLYGYLAARWGWSETSAILAASCSLLLLIAVIDLEHSLVPNSAVGIGAVLVVGLAALGRAHSLVICLLGGMVGGLVFLGLAALRQGALGMGDVKLAALIGLLTGFPWVLQALVLSIMLGGVAAALALVTRRRTGAQYMPYAPYLVAGSLITLLQGRGIAGWYSSPGLGG